jgi:hypothetical protein
MVSLTKSDREKKLMALFKKDDPPPASVPGVSSAIPRNPEEEKQALIDAVSARPSDPREAWKASLDAGLNAAGITVDDHHGQIHLPEPSRDLDEGLFPRRPDTWWVDAVGLKAALEAVELDRPGRALLFARLGRLDKAEIRHLRWMATAERPDDRVTSETPLTADDARAALAAAGLAVE